MTTMKKILTLLLASCLLLALAGCPAPEPEEPHTEPATTIGDTTAQSETSLVQLYLPYVDEIEPNPAFVTLAAHTEGTAEDIVALLVEHGALPEGCAVLSFQLDKCCGNTAMLDMNAAYAEALSRTGTFGEYLLLGSLVNTFLMFYEIDSISLTADGQVLETGHEVYDYPLTFLG